MQDPKELLKLCQKIAGLTIRELAAVVGLNYPISLHSNKGWIGKLLETYLGASGNNLPIPDFPTIGVELKTIPVRSNMISIGSTYVCTAPLNAGNTSWEQSIVRLKLTKVLWVPIEYVEHLPFIERRIGQAFLWQPDLEQYNVLKNDWQELNDMLRLGKLELLSAKYGKYLQIRPKAANCKDNLVEYINSDGELIYTVARGFYLRTSFTRQILAKQFQSKS